MFTRRLAQSVRGFHTTRPVFIRAPEKTYSKDPFDLDESMARDDGPTSYGWELQRQEREMLNVMRTIEKDAAKLREFRMAFNPPSTNEPIVVRSLSYGREQHPATAKRTVVVPVARLELHPDPKYLHKLKLLAGVRWSLQPPKNSGLAKAEGTDEKGYITISCEDFPEAPMNLKWASDVLDAMVREANNPQDSLEDIPTDSRHVASRQRKQRSGGHSHSLHRPTLADFPKDWLPGPGPSGI